MDGGGGATSVLAAATKWPASTARSDGAIAATIMRAALIRPALLHAALLHAALIHAALTHAALLRVALPPAGMQPAFAAAKKRSIMLIARRKDLLKLRT